MIERRSKERLKVEEEMLMESELEISGKFNQLNIDAMISQEADEKQRVTLLILQSINNSLVANTSLTRALVVDLKGLSTTFADHEKKHEAIINKTKGVKIVLPILGFTVTIIQGLVIYLWLQNTSAVENITSELARDVKERTEMRRNIDVNLEKHIQLDVRVSRIEGVVDYNKHKGRAR